MKTSNSNIVLPEGNNVDIIKVIHEVGLDNVHNYQIDIASDVEWLYRNILKGYVNRFSKVVWGTRDCGSEIGRYDNDIMEVHFIEYHIINGGGEHFSTLFELSDLHIDNEAGSIIGNMRMINPYEDYSDTTLVSTNTKTFIENIKYANNDKCSRAFYREHPEYTPSVVMS